MEPIIDDVETLKSIDKSKMLKALAEFPESCVKAVKNAEKTSLGNLSDKKFRCIVFTGMGGSAIGGQLIYDWLMDEASVPIFVSRGYHLPKFVDSDSLVIVVSYSGNTEETLNALHEAIARDSYLITVSSGGKLKKISIRREIPHFSMPTGLRPRAALPDQFFTLATILKRLEIFSESWKEFNEVLSILEILKGKLAPAIPTNSNISKKLAMDLKDMVPFVYGTRLFEGVTYRIRTQINENSKVPAGSGVFPELFHNAVLGMEEPKEGLNRLAIVNIHDPRGKKAVNMKIEKFTSLIKPKVGKILQIVAEGDGKLSRMLSTLYVGDYMATYLGLLYGHDPSSMTAIEALKR